MTRPVLEDYLQNYPFWLFDVFTAVTPSLPALNPLWGFSTCSVPETIGETMAIQEGNRVFPRQVFRSGTYKPLTLTRGVRFFDNDFYRWLQVTTEGDPSHFHDLVSTLGIDVAGPTPRRTLVLLHFLSHLPQPPVIGRQFGTGGEVAGVVANTIASNAVAGIQAVMDFLQPFSAAFDVLRIPARAWLLTGCLPTRYKPGSDFDASSGEVSIQEIDIQPEGVEQISLVDL